MPYHIWGDEDFDWDALGQAEHMLNKIARRWRIGIHTKEKYGTLRCSVYLFDGSLHSIVYPGHVYIRWHNKYIKSWDRKLAYPNNFIYAYIVGKVQYLQLCILRMAYRKVIKKYPHIEAEIVVDHPFSEGFFPEGDKYNDYS